MSMKEVLQLICVVVGVNGIVNVVVKMMVVVVAVVVVVMVVVFVAVALLRLLPFVGGVG